MTATDSKPCLILPLGTLARVERLLTDLLGAQRGLLDAVRAHRDAIRQADTRRIGACVAEQGARLACIDALERERQALVAEVLAAQPAGQARPLITLSRLAEQASSPTREQMLVRAEEVRTAMRAVQDEQRLVRVVSAALGAHMEGLMRQVARRLSAAGVYSRGGYVAATPELACGLDLRS